ncbi:MAG: hypothetical protein CMG59_06515 [Candidatus Marinimicrobia bacterium]|nr:hypothetical protein [Candidatus Neomarinimicrobiota bacterium]|tara:strand:- start:73 stop:357 length:285 start_codon:yes stop_codon:yes gene_type:complete
MFIEMNLIYPFKSTRKKIIHSLEKYKLDIEKLDDCIEFNIYKDTYSEKIIYMIKWTSWESMNENTDKEKFKKRVEEMMNLQKFPAEVYRLEENH